MGALRLGKIGGVQAEVHLTFGLTLLWGGWQGWAQYGTVGGAAFGALLILLLFGCVLAHELGHALQAEALGLTVRRVTLLPIGGLAQLDHPPSTPYHELLIALAGPAVNLVLVLLVGVALLAWGDITPGGEWQSFLALLQRQPGMLGAVVYLLASNASLFMFNMLPIFPMDGGRVVRAGLALVMDYESATQVATRLGRAMAIVLGVVGVLGFPRYGVTLSLSLVLVALMVYAGARQEEIYVRSRRALIRLEARDACRKPVRMVRPADPVTPDLATILTKRRVAVPVVENGELVGLVTSEDLRSVLRHSEPVYVAHVMRTHYPVLHMHDTLWVALQVMNEHNLSGVPVVQDGAFCGMVALEDIERAWRLSPQRRHGANSPR